ncbi:hypothetical protein MMC06_004150, partial [Schaereria dolodes]|nr:hypothetical protein [Schaereria dolodes]
MSPSRTEPLPQSASNPPGLTPSQLQSFEQNGYLIIPNAVSPATISTLLADTHSLLSSFPLSSHPLTKFSTGDSPSSSSSSAHIGDTYFLTSGDKVRFFFDEDAFTPSGALSRPQERAVNKIGHCLHALVPSFRAATLTPRHAAIARALGFRDPRVLQSMVICKQPEIGGRVPPHQDSTFLYTDPPSAVGFWIALEDAGVGNGCLSFARGSHRRVGVRKRFVRRTGEEEGKEGGGTGFVDVQGRRFPEGMEVEVGDGEGEGKKEEGEEGEEYEAGEVKAGTLVLIHGNLLHKSERN